MHIFMFVLGWLTLTAALLCLAWQTWCAGRWLYRWLHPWNEAVDARFKAYQHYKPHPLWPEREGRTLEIPTYPSLNRSPYPTTAAMPTISADTDTAQEIPPPLDIPCPTPIVDGLPLAVEDMSWARRSSFRVVDSPASTEET